MHHAIGTEHDIPADTDVRYDPAIVPYNRFRSDPTMWADRDVGADPSGAIDYRGRMDAFVDMHGQLKKLSQLGECNPRPVYQDYVRRFNFGQLLGRHDGKDPFAFNEREDLG